MEAQDRKCGTYGHQGASVTLFFPWRSSFPCKDDCSWNIDRVLQGLPGQCPPPERAHSCILSGSNLIAGARVCVVEGFLQLLLLFMLWTRLSVGKIFIWFVPRSTVQILSLRTVGT